ncbi:MAG: glycosyltransferase family 39 protein [Chloroflexota bacterium]
MQAESTQRQSNISLILGTILVLGAAFFLKVQYLLWGDWTYDQGFYFVVARLMDMGYTPYQHIHMSEQPLMAWSSHWPYQIFGSIWGMQFFMVGYTLLTLAALISIGHALNNARAGLLAAAILILHFMFFRASHTVNPETTSIGLALISLASALQFRIKRKSYWLWISAVTMAGSFLLKLFMVFMVPIVLLVLLIYTKDGLPHQLGPILKKRQTWRDIGIWTGLFVVALFGVWFWVGIPALVEQSILFYIRRNAAHVRDASLNTAKITTLLSSWPILTVFAIVGIVTAFRQIKQAGWLTIIWLALSLIFLYALSPLREKHLLLILPILALLGGIGLDALLGFLQSVPQSTQRTTRLFGVGGILLVGALLVELAFPFHRLSRPNKPLVEEPRWPIVEALQKFTSPADCIVTDDPYIAFVANRMPPPWLSNLSYARFRSGSISTQDLVDITNESQCQMVFSTYDRIKNSDRPYYDWAKDNFLHVWIVDDHEIMLGKPLTAANPMRPSDFNFNDQVDLVGLDWIEGYQGESRQAHFSLYWHTHQAFHQPFKIFVQLRDQNGQTVASADHEMFDGRVPTTNWPVDRIIKDTNILQLPADIAPGTYNLYVGFYDPATVERLTIINDQSGENAAVFSQIALQ